MPFLIPVVFLYYLVFSQTLTMSSIEMLTCNFSFCFQCFFCKEEKDFDNLCQEIRMKLIIPEKQHLFELFDEKPQSWVPPDGSAEEALRAVGG